MTILNDKNFFTELETAHKKKVGSLYHSAQILPAAIAPNQKKGGQLVFAPGPNENIFKPHSRNPQAQLEAIIHELQFDEEGVHETLYNFLQDTQAIARNSKIAIATPLNIQTKLSGEMKTFWVESRLPTKPVEHIRYTSIAAWLSKRTIYEEVEEDHHLYKCEIYNLCLVAR